MFGKSLRAKRVRDSEDTSVFSPFTFSPSLKIGLWSVKAARTKYCEQHLNLARHSIICTAQNETFAGTPQSICRLECCLNDRGFIVEFPAEFKRCNYFQGVRTRSEVYTFPNQWLQRYIFPGIKRLEREADHSPLSSAEVTNVCCYTSTHPIWLHGVEPNTGMSVCVCVSPYTKFRHES
jgi:hypothetical protein